MDCLPSVSDALWDGPWAVSTPIWHSFMLIWQPRNSFTLIGCLACNTHEEFIAKEWRGVSLDLQEVLEDPKASLLILTLH